ncbi:hypothetical protein SEA_MALISHA_60 [Gordonia phage Malisha]|nr:hypothetical protein SEA_MALISHA_60 [Gordonia phage Malisha]
MERGPSMTGYTAAESQALIKRARVLYLSQNPFDPHKKAVPAVDGSGMPAGFMTFPDIGEMQILGCKLGMEYLAICHDEDAVEDWINTCLSLAKSPELTGILMANVFRGINTVLGEILNGRRDAMTAFAIDAWGRDFSKGEQSDV